MPGQAIISVNENQWTVSLASTYAELTTGLRGVASLAANTGMLFILPAAQAPSVDTTGMNFPLDIIFIANNIVIDVARNIEPGYLVTEETPCDSFLEVNVGEAILVEAGDIVNVETVAAGAFDFSSIISFAVPLALLGFVCAMAGGMMTGVVGSSSPPKLLLNSSKPKPTEKVTVKAGKETSMPMLPQVLIEGGESGKFEAGEIVNFKGERVRVLEHVGDRVSIWVPSRQEEAWVKPESLKK